MNEQEQAKLRYISNRLIEMSDLLDNILAPTLDTMPADVDGLMFKVVSAWCARYGYSLVKVDQGSTFPPDTLLIDAAGTDGHFLRRLRYGKKP